MRLCRTFYRSYEFGEFIYLRNKETQQTLRVIVSIQYDATLLQQGILEPIFYGDLVYKFKRIVGNPILMIDSKNSKTLYKGWI